MAGLINGNDNISCQSVMHVQLCMWRSPKFTFTFKFMPRVPGYPSGTRVINYPG